MGDMGHHGGHGGHMHASHGGDGMGLSQSVGVTHGQQHHGFLSHLLGLDHDAAGQHGHQSHSAHSGVPVDRNPQGSPSWSSPLQAIKISDALQGISLTPNTMFLMLFFAFGAWLAVIYWVRHHEPLANQVLGSTGGYSTTAQADRQLVAGMRYAVPIRTSNATGAVYVPMSGLDSQPLAASAGAYAANPAPAPSANPSMENVTPNSENGSANVSSTPVPSAYGASTPPVASSPMASYMVPVQTPEGLRVKFITNR